MPNYPNLIKEEFLPYLSPEKIELINNLDTNSNDIYNIFNKIITPKESTKYPKEISEYITEGLINIYTINFMKKHKLTVKYDITKVNNILFIQDALNIIGDKESIDMLTFNGSIDQIIESTYGHDKLEEIYTNSKDNKTEYDILINHMVDLMPNIKHKEDYLERIQELTIQNGKETALRIIKQIMRELNPYDIDNCTPEEISIFTQSTIAAIDDYLELNLNHSKINA